jgi:hypothetical protein
MSLKKYVLQLTALTALCATSAFAGPYIANKPWWAFTHIDFAASSALAGHVGWDTWTVNGSAGTKFMRLVLDKKSSGAGQCYSISIEDQGAIETVDLQFFNDATGVSIDDDGPAGDRRPRARFWITSEFFLRISAFSNSYNNVDFGIYNYLESATTAATCDDGVSPFYNQATNTLVRANTTAN